MKINGLPCKSVNLKNTSIPFEDFDRWYLKLEHERNINFETTWESLIGLIQIAMRIWDDQEMTKTDFQEPKQSELSELIWI